MPKWFVVGVYLCGLLAFQASYAEKMDSLYQVKSYVADEWVAPSDSELVTAISQIVQRVCACKIQDNVLQKIKKIPDASQYLQGFELKPTKQVQYDQKGNAYLARELTLLFNQGAVFGLLKKEKMTPVSVYRPSTLFWINPQSEGSALTLEQSLAELLAYGDAVAMPSMLMPETARFGWLTVQRHWTTLERRMRGYPIDWMVIGDLYAETESRWALVRGDEPTWQVFKGPYTEQIAQLYTWLAEVAGRRLAKDQQSKKTIELTVKVSSVKNVKDYSALLSFLNALPFISHVRIVSQEASTLTLSISSQFNQEQALLALTVDRQLQSMRMLSRDTGSALIALRWIGR